MSRCGDLAAKLRARRRKTIDVKRDFLSKQGEVTLQVARHLLGVIPGDRLPTVSEYCELLKAGAGTVQAALRALVEAGAVRLESHGYQGTYVVSVNRSLLWRYGLHNVLFGAMPLPYTGRLLGLATGLYDQFERAGIPFSLAYVRGGRWRVKRLLEGKTDFIVCSRLTARLAQKEDPGLTMVEDLGEETYIGQCVLVFADSSDREIRDGMRVGIDESSYDQATLTRTACGGKKVVFVPLSYTEIFPKLRQGSIDATAWSLDEVQEKKLDLPVVPFSGNELVSVARDAGKAVVLVQDGKKNLSLLIREVLDRPTLCQVQQDVMLGRRIPSY